MTNALDGPYRSVDRGVLQALGLVIVNFSQLEYLLRMGISALLVGTRADDAPDLVTSKLGFRALIDLYACLYNLRFKDEPGDEVQRECERLEKLNDRRNHVVHSLWGTGGTETTLTQFRTQVRRKGAIVSELQVSEAELLAFAQEIDSAHVRLSDLVLPVILGVDDRLPK